VELVALESKTRRTSYPSRVITPDDRERYDQNIRTTRLALKNHTGEQLLDTLETALTKRDRVTAEAVYKEALGRGASSTDLGVPTSEAHRVVERFHRAYPDRRESYQRGRSAKAQHDDPARLLFKGLHMKAGPRREAGDTMGDWQRVPVRPLGR